MLDIAKTVDGGKVTYALAGRLDTYTAPDLQESLDEALEGVTELVFDFEGLDYISSAGLRVLLRAQKTMNDQGSMRLVNVNENIMGILEVTGFADILTIE